MSGRKTRDFLWRYGLAGACIGLPLVLFIIMEITLVAFVSDAKVSGISLPYKLRDEANVVQAASETLLRNPVPSTAKKAGSDGSEPATKKIEPDPNMRLWGNYIAGRYNVVATTGFICLISIISAVFGAATIYRRANAPAIVAIGVAVFLFAAAAASGLYFYKFARFLVVDAILNHADAHILLKQIKKSLPTADIVNLLVLLTNFVGYAASGLVLGALATLSVRARQGELTADELKQRRNHIRVALVLASAILAISVISTKLLLQWPLSLLIESQAVALNTLSEAILFRWGSLGTITLVAAFIPAITAWYLDVEAFRARASVGGKTAKSVKAVREDDGLDFAWMPAFGSAVAVLAPLLASPFADTLQALLSNVK